MRSKDPFQIFKILVSDLSLEKFQFNNFFFLKHGAPNDYSSLDMSDERREIFSFGILNMTKLLKA